MLRAESPNSQKRRAQAQVAGKSGACVGVTLPAAAASPNWGAEIEVTCYCNVTITAATNRKKVNDRILGDSPEILANKGCQE